MASGRDHDGRKSATRNHTNADLATAGSADGQPFALLKTVFQKAEDAVVVTSADADNPCIEYANDAFTRLTGYPLSEILGRSPKFLQGPGTSHSAREAIHHALDRKCPARVEMLNYDREGSEYWIDISVFPILGPDGEVAHFAAIQRDITEQKRQAARLTRLEARLRAAMEGSPSAFYLLEGCRSETGVVTDFRLTDVNTIGEREIGQPRDEVVGQRLSDLLSLNGAAGLLNRYRAVLETGNPIDEEICMELSTGGTSWQRQQVVRVGDSIAVTSQDVTDRKRAEQNRVQAELRLRGAISSIRDGFVLFDAQDRLVMCNQQFVDSYPFLGDIMPLEGRAFEEILRIGLARDAYADPLATEDPEAWLAARLENHRNPPPEPLEQQAHGGRWIRISEQRTADGCIAGIYSDVTALKRAETRLLDAVDSIGEGFALFDEDDRLVLYNRPYLEYWGEVADDIQTGMTFRDLCARSWDAGLVQDPDVDAETDREAWIEQKVQRHHAASGVIERTMPGNRHFNITERRTKDGGIATIASDVSEIKRAQEIMRDNETILKRNIEDLETTRALLQEKSDRLAELAGKYALESQRASAAARAKSQFLAMMSHELRTPLNAILGFSDMIRDEAAGLEGYNFTEFADDIYNSGDHLLSLINDILDMSKVEAGKYEIHPEPIDPRGAIDYSVRLIRGRPEEAGVRLTVDMDQDLPPIEADERALRQILLNLLSNAIKFTDRGGEITITAAGNADGLTIAVTDTGIGIAEEHLPRITRPFEQVDSELSRRHKGTGLGLALTKALVELHGGTFAIESKLGIGTTVRFSMPWYDEGSAGLEGGLAAQAGR